MRVYSLLTADGDFPTLSTLISETEKRRDGSEARIRAEILNLELNLVRNLNNFAANALRNAAL